MGRGVYLRECIYSPKYIFLTIYKRASVSFCANARKSRPNFQKASIFSKRKGQSGRLHIPMDNVCSACLPALCLDNARKSRPKTSFLKGGGGTVYIGECIYFQEVYILKNVYKKASIFSKRKGQSGRLHIPMDNVCSACLPALCLDNANKSRPKTPFLRGVGRGVYLGECIYSLK